MQTSAALLAGLKPTTFPRLRLISSALVFVAPALVACSGDGGGSQALDNPVEGDAQAISRGFDIYELQCRACHSDIDRGSSGPALSGIIPRSSDGELVDVIENGTSGMPGFSDVLTRDDVWALIAYLRDEAP